MAEKFNISYSNVRPTLLEYVQGSDLRVLDVGCANGINGQYLKGHNIAQYVEGIELDKEMASAAAKRIDTVISGDLDDPSTLKKISDTPFDYMIFGDILEHLKDPCSVLAYFVKNHLAKTGKVLISVPNIQHIEVFYQIFIRGKWPRNNRGIFDKTHLVCFTEKNIHDLVRHASLKMDSMNRVFRYRDSLNSRFPRFTKTFLTKIFPKLFTFQYTVLCSHE